MNEIGKYNESIFEKIRYIDKNGKEYWLARELQLALGYKKWQKFINVIDAAKTACEQSRVRVNDHFTQVGKTSKMPNGGVKNLLEYRLSRYACYLIVQNSDPKKEVVALGQTYFAIQTRKQEIFETEYSLLSEDEKRIYQRAQTRKGNYSLNQTAKKAGVKNFDKFHNAGYRGLYNGETADDIAKRKGLRYREDILDNMGSEELVDNLFRITHTEQKLKREHIQGENNASEVHYQVGKKVRETIKELGSTMPEDLLTPEKSLKQLERENNKKKNVDLIEE